MYIPQYDGSSLVNLMSSIGRVYGRAVGYYPVCDEVEALDLAQYDNVILLVIDGLGYEYLQSRPGFLHEHCHCRLTSVFPSTTATSISAFMTGLAPQQHGLTGWFTYLQELGGVTAVLPFRLRGADTDLTEAGYDLKQVYQHPVFFDQLNCPTTVVSENWILNTAFNQAHTGRARTAGYDSMDEMFAVLAECVKHAGQRQYIYAYWSEFDHLSHLHGNGSDTVAEHFKQLQAQAEQFIRSVRGSNTMLLITADHGFIDTRPDRYITVNDHPQMLDCLAQPLSGEPRVAYCYIKPGQQQRFVDYVNEHFSERLDCLESRVLLESQYFGLGPAHARLAQRIGDFTLVMKENYVITDWLPGEKPFFFAGVHGGVSAQEMFIPLVALNA